MVKKKLPQIKPADEWNRFLSFCSSQVTTQFVYRGVPNASYHLQPSIGRIPKYSELKERRINIHFKRRAELHLPLASMSQLDQLVLAQHHGLPTRLLDWSSSPLVAAYFAVFASDFERGKDFRIYYLRTKREDYLPPDVDDPSSVAGVKFYLPRLVSPRIAAQSGLFSIHKEPLIAWQDSRIDSIVFSAAARSLFARRLHFLGITAQKLFPGLDGLAATLRWQLYNGIELWHLT